MPKPNPHAQALGRLGGLARSPQKTAAARRNAMKSVAARKAAKLARKPGA